MHNSTASNLDLFSTPSNHNHDNLSFRVIEGPLWTQRLLRFHQSVISSLSNHEKHFLLSKDMSFFQTALTNKNAKCLVGLFDNHIAGMAILTCFNNYQDALENNALTYKDSENFISDFCQGQKIFTLQSVCSSTQFSGLHIAPKILDYSRALIKEQDDSYNSNQHLFAQAARDNCRGIKLFESRGYAPLDSWTTNYARVILHCRL